MKQQIQQGDVNLERIDCIPEGAKKRDSYILAEGESTGHKHKLQVAVAEKEKTCEVYEKNGTLYLRVFSPTPLIHEEHNPVLIPEGNWEVGNTYEYDHFAEEARIVRD